MSYSFQLGKGMGEEGNPLMIFVFLIFKFFSSSNTVGTAILSQKKTIIIYLIYLRKKN